MPHSPPPRAYATLALAQLAMGLAGIFARLALTGTGAIEVTFLRLLIAAPIIVIVAFLRGKLLRLDRATALRLLLGGATLGIHFVLWIISLCYISVALSTLLVCTTPFWLALYDALVARRRFARSYRFGIPLAALSLLFVVFFSPQPAAAVPVPGAALEGCLFALGAAILVGLYLVIIRPAQERLRTLTVTAYTFPGALAALAPLALIARQPVPHTVTAWAGIGLIAGFTHLIGHTSLSASLRYFDPTSIAFICLFEPVIAAVAATLFLHQALTWQVVTGGVCLLSAIALILHGERKADAPDAPLQASGLP